MSTTDATPRPPSLWTKLTYGFGMSATGVADNGLSFFLLIFYSQVIGVDARLVSIALTVALVFDAFVDPVVGYWSDNLRSKWGRRHPFLYASALPAAAAFWLLWNPPTGWSDQSLFWYLLVVAVAVRTMISFFETPSAALAAELTDNYDQRSSLLSYRYYFAWTVGNLMSVLMFARIFPMFVTAAISNGQFNRESYALYGWITSILIAGAVLTSALGTHGRIPHLKPPPPKREITLARAFKEVFETLVNRSFIALFLAAMFGAIGNGLAAALTFYFLTYFWGFSGPETLVIVIGTFISAILGAVLAPLATRLMGKKRAAMSIGLLAVLGSPLPIVLKLFGLLPDDPQFIFWFVFIGGVIDVGLIVCFQILFASMIADLVEQSELKTGRRSEGLFFSAATFIRKLVQGLGVIAAGVVLWLAQFPEGATPEDVSADSIWRLGAYYVPILLFVWLAMIAVISTYKLNRESHEENLRQLAARGPQAP